jgi:hypothetical protein
MLASPIYLKNFSSYRNVQLIAVIKWYQGKSDAFSDVVTRCK